MRLPTRTIISIVTFVLIALVLWFTRDELVYAWELLRRVNLWILALFIPVVLLNYYAAGEMVFSYLRKKNAMKQIRPLEQMRISLEMNFVNHVLPSGGASGVSYMTWRLSKLGVSKSKAAMALAVRIVAGFVAFSLLLLLAVIMVTFDGEINRWVILVSSTLFSAMVAVTVGLMYILRSRRRLHKVSVWTEKTVNRLVRKVTRGRRRVVVHQEDIEHFLMEMHDDYISLRRDYRILKQPIIWGVVFTCTDIALFFVTFLALGHVVNPAPILLAYGVAAIAGFAVLTPGGSGAYEALMVGLLTITGLSQGLAIAGVVLTRVLVLLVIIAIGYIFYQQAIVKYGGKRGYTPAQR